MNTETQASGLDTVKLAMALLLLGGGVVAFYWFGEQSLLLRVLGLLAVAGIAIAIASQTAKGRSIWGFMGDTRTDVRKVVWPTRAETVQTTIAVMVMVFVLGIILWLLDMFLFWAIRVLTGQGG
jgi:preprotein translocase subunit SecE